MILYIEYETLYQPRGGGRVVQNVVITTIGDNVILSSDTITSLNRYGITIGVDNTINNASNPYLDKHYGWIDTDKYDTNKANDEIIKHIKIHMRGETLKNLLNPDL
jgi:hypothetical protein